MKKVILVFFFIILSSFSYSALTDDLIHYWSFDIDARDDVDGSMNGSVSGATHLSTSCAWGDGCYFFNASETDKITTPAFTQGGSNWTYSIWGNFTRTDIDMIAFRARNDGAATNRFTVEWLYYGSGNQVYAQVWDNITMQSIVQTGTDYPENTWYHLVLAYNTSHLLYYVNGELNGTVAANNVPESSEILVIGDNHNNRYWEGNLDEIGYWNRTLTASEVSDLYSTGNPILAGQGPPTIDQSTYNHTSAYFASNETAWRISTITPSITNDTTPSVIFETDINAYCRIGDTDNNWTTMGDTRNCTSTGTDHNCNLINGDALSGFGYHNIYIACIDDTLTYENTTSTSGPLNISLINSTHIIHYIAPNTTNPLSVTYPQNVSINFSVYFGDIQEITSDLTMKQILVNQTNVSIFSSNTDIELYIRSDDDANTNSSNPETISFLDMNDTYYISLISMITAGNTPYAYSFSGKTTTGYTVDIDDDKGSNEEANFMYGAISRGEFNLTSGDFIKCGNTSSASSGVVTFTYPFPNTNYSVICTPAVTGDSPVCNLYGNTNTTGFAWRTNNDLGQDFTVDGVDWCAFSDGEYSEGSVSFKVNQSVQSGGTLTGTFITNFATANYSLFITNRLLTTDDGCTCEVTSRTVSGFTAICEDDGSSINNCDDLMYEWVAFTNGDYNLTIEGSSYTEFAYLGSYWQANVSLPDLSTGLKDLTLNMTSLLSSSIHIESEAFNYGASDSCTYGGSGNWVITDYCDITTAVDVCPNYINISTGGYLNLTGSASINASKLYAIPKDSDPFRLRTIPGTNIFLGICS